MEGDWSIDIYLKDRVGNSDFYPAGNITVASGPQPPALVTRNFLAQAVDAIGHPWSSTGWVMQSQESNDGIDAAASRPVADSGESILETTVTGPGTMNFQWRTDSEQDSDFLSVAVDGTVIEQISGFTGWIPGSVTIPAGSHTVSWRYSKNASGSSGEDRGWVDQVRFQRTTDEALPQLQDVRISPRPLDLSNGTSDVTFQIEVTDDLNGLLEGRVELFDPAGNPRVSTSFNGSTPNEGTSLAGTYQVVLPVFNDVASGLWRVEITLTEATTNATRKYGGATGEAYPIRAIETFYAGNVLPADVTEPTVRALAITPGAVNVSNGSATATVTLQITDEIAGFNSGNISVLNPTGAWTGAFYFDNDDRISGDAYHGIYQIEVVVPRYGNPGNWSVACYVSDNNSNDHEYPYDLPFQSDVRGNYTVTNTGTIDLADPFITSMEVTPSQISTSSGPAQVQVTVAIEDDVSGILQAFAYFYDPADNEQAPLQTTLDVSNRIDGDDLSGVYQFTKTIPQGSAAGQWQVRIFIRDKTGKPRFYGQPSEPYPQLGDGLFTVGAAPASLYQAFTNTYSLTGNDALPSADPDHDGRNNATELMLGTHPFNATSNGNGMISLNRDASHVHLDFTIASGLTATVNGSWLELRDGGGGSPLLLKGQTNSGLTGQWADTLPVPVPGPAYRVSLPFANGPKGFLRLFFETP